MSILKILRVQISLLSFLLVLSALSTWGFIPPLGELTAQLNDLFDAHGVISIGIISFIENVIGLNAFFPGSIVILLAMSMTAGDPERALITFLFIYIPAVAAHNINYMLGVLGFSASKPDEGRRIKTTSKSSIAYLFAITFWHPHFTALSCLTAGAEGMKYRKFIFWFLSVSLPWNIFWALLMYNVGSSIGSDINFMPIMIAYIFVWGVYDYIMHDKSQNKAITKSSNKV
jgi:membrane protein DedA with SNARE-associated domain